MQIFYVFFTLCFLINTKFSVSLNFNKLDEIFKDEDCILGEIAILDSQPVLIKTSDEGSDTLLQQKTESSVVSANVKSNNPDLLVQLQTNIDSSKNYLGLLNELAQFNKVEVEYLLTKEEGLPHARIFHVRLNLGNEVYNGVGTSIKKGKMAAAMQALNNSKLEKPPTKAKTTKEIEKLTPTVLLNNIAAKLGMKVEYINENGKMTEEELSEVDYTTHNYIALDQTTKSYVQKLNDSVKHKIKHITVSDEKAPESPFKVQVVVGEKTFSGTGWTIQAARHDAANNALKHFQDMSLKDAEKCLAEGETCNKLAIKSPISLVYETATLRNLGVTFEIIEESGPAHKKNFVTQCKVGSVITQGEGSSKKASKKKAAENMIAKLAQIEPLQIGSSINVNSPNKKNKNRKKNKISKGLLNNAKVNVLDAVSNVYNYFSEESTDVPNDSTDGHKKDLLKLTNELGINLKFATYPNGNMHSSIVTIDTNPSYICHSKDVSRELSEENASLSALKFLKQVGLDNIIIPLKPGKNNKVRLDVNHKVDASNTIPKDELR